MYVFLIKDETLFGRYKKTWEKVSNIIKKEFNSELVYNKRYLKAKKNKTKERFHWGCGRVILIDSVYRKDENYYP